MQHAVHPALDPQAESEIVAAIIALDWNVDLFSEPLAIIQKRLGLQNEEQAVAVFGSLQKKGLMFCKPKHMAVNLLEGERARPFRGKWFPPEE